MIFKIVFESINNIIFVFSENCFCSLNFFFSILQNIKKKKKNWESNVFFLLSLFFRIENSFQKQIQHMPLGSKVLFLVIFFF